MPLLTGWLPVAAKEGRATVLSPRLVIIASVLALTFLAGTYAITPGGGGGGPGSSQIVFAFTYNENLHRERYAVAIFAADVAGVPLPGVEFQLLNITRSEDPEDADLLETKETDVTGWVRFEGLTERYPNSQLIVDRADSPGSVLEYVSTFGYYDPCEELPPEEPCEPEFYMVRNEGRLRTATLPLGLSPEQQYLYLVFTDANATPIEGAAVHIRALEEAQWDTETASQEPAGGWAPYLNGTTDANGFYVRPEPLGSGFYVVHVSDGTLNSTSFPYVSEYFGPLKYGPDGVLAFSGLLFIPLVLPIMALVVASGAIARERAEGTLDALLSKPVSRIGVGVGKFAGAFASMALPVTVILVLAALLVWLRTDLPPTLPFVAAFVGETLLLLAIYTLIFLAISANVRSRGTALLVSILVFVLFAFFWALISFFVLATFSGLGPAITHQIATLMLLVPPGGAYERLLFLSMPGLPGFNLLFGFALGTTAEVPLAWIAAAAALWVALPLALFLAGMKYRVTKA